MAHPLPEELAPIVLPELGGLRVSFAMCVNRMCPHFGLHYGTEEGSDGSSDSRYEIRDRTQDDVPGKKLVCRYCGIERNLHVATSIRPITRHFLSESLPFADCPREDCENHGLNAYGCMPAESPGRLQDLGRLRRLNLAGNPVSELSPLGDVETLVWLTLPGDSVGLGAEPLGRLTRLRWVWGHAEPQPLVEASD